ncbi:MAG: type I-C CRISPR-associated protein Cas8c/Csd1 [Planctomycetaceae bacterium]|nr:type I-C CRISPR-associated protein Cas8c/Csd1 [Planctomycetaceae bacterium]
MSKGLNETHPSPAYHAGRFLAVCQHIQDLGDSEINATYVDRFFAGASTYPCGVLPRVHRVARHRLKKIDNWNVRSDIEATLVQLHSQLSREWPGHLNTVDQGLFQLGFFHQLASLPRNDGRARIPTLRGDPVKSNGEQTIANILYSAGIHDYKYEEPLIVPGYPADKKPMEPDFTLVRPIDGATLLIEYTGREGDEKYDRQWNWKATRYRHMQARPIEDCMIDGKFPNRVLIHIRPHDRHCREVFERSLLRQVRSFLAGKLLDEDLLSTWAP